MHRRLNNDACLMTPVVPGPLSTKYVVQISQPSIEWLDELLHFTISDGKDCWSGDVLYSYLRLRQLSVEKFCDFAKSCIMTRNISIECTANSPSLFILGTGDSEAALKIPLKHEANNTATFLQSMACIIETLGTRLGLYGGHRNVEYNKLAATRCPPSFSRYMSVINPGRKKRKPSTGFKFKKIKMASG